MGKEIISREKRVLSLNANTTGKRVGPGTYDYDVDIIRAKKQANVSFKWFWVIFIYIIN